MSSVGQRVQRLRLAIAIATVTIAAGTIDAGTAAAGTSTTEVVAWPDRLRALYVGVGVSYFGHQSLGGPSVTGEQAWGYGRWQLGVEGSVRWLPVSGVAVRSAIDTKWLARSFCPDDSAAIELYLDAGMGAEVIAAPGVVAMRPDVRFGFGLQVRDVGPFHVRLAIRLSIAPSFEREEAQSIACRGTCTLTTTSSPPIDEGFEGLLGIAW